MKIRWVQERRERGAIFGQQVLRILALNVRLRLGVVQLVTHEVVEFGLVAGDEAEARGNRLIKVVVVQVLYRCLEQGRVCHVENWNALELGDQATSPLANDQLVIVVNARSLWNLVLQVARVGSIKLSHHRILTDDLLHLLRGELCGVTFLEVAQNLLVHRRIAASLIGLHPLTHCANGTETVLRVAEDFLLESRRKSVESHLVEYCLVLVAPVIEIVGEVPRLYISCFERILDSRDGHEGFDVVGTTVADELGPETEGAKVWHIYELSLCILMITITIIGSGFRSIMIWLSVHVVLFNIVNGRCNWSIF